MPCVTVKSHAMYEFIESTDNKTWEGSKIHEMLKTLSTSVANTTLVIEIVKSVNL